MRDILMLTTKISKTKVKKKKRMPEKSESMASSTVRRVGGRREGGGEGCFHIFHGSRREAVAATLPRWFSVTHTQTHTHSWLCIFSPPLSEQERSQTLVCGLLSLPRP